MGNKNWKEMDLKSYKYIKGYPFKSALYLPGGTRIIRVSDITPMGFNDSNKIYIKYVNEYSKWILEPNDIVVTTVGSKPPMYNSIVGMPLLITEKNSGYLLNQNNVVLKIGDKALARLIYENMLTKSYLDHITQIFRGNANQANIAVNDLIKFNFSVPSDKNEVEQIAKRFENIDELIFSLEKLYKKKLNVMNGMIYELFENNKDWKSVLIKKIGNVATGKTPNTDNEHYYGNKYLWVTPTDIVGKELKFTGRMLTDEGLSKAQFIPANSVLVTCIASIGKNTILREAGSCNQQINAITPYEGYDVDFIYYLLGYNSKLLRLSAGQGGMQILTKENFENIELLVPEYTEQQRIASILNNMDNELDKLSKKIDKYKQIKKGMIESILIGKDNNCYE